MGRIDEETGKIVPTKRKRCTAADITSDTDEVVTSLIDAIAERDETICSLRGEISMLQREIHKISDDLVSFGRRLAQQH